ncbi:hypothetical protein ACFL6U_32665 [Planctomycetota bacterium]
MNMKVALLTVAVFVSIRIPMGTAAVGLVNKPNVIFILADDFVICDATA